MTINSREEIKKYIDTADANIVFALKAVIEAYEAKDVGNPISKIENTKDLPVELQKKIKKSRKDFEEGRTYTHEEVMEKVNEKFPLFDDKDIPF